MDFEGAARSRYSVRVTDDVAIIAGFLAGNDDSHRQVDRWIDEVVRGAHLGLDADDVAQEVRRKLLVSFRAEQFRGEASLRTYVWRLARTTAIDHIRARRRRPLAEAATLHDVEELETGHPGPEGALAARERREVFERIWAALDPKCREIFGLLLFEGLPYATIAKRLGTTEDNARARAHRCRSKGGQILRALLGGPRAGDKETP